MAAESGEPDAGVNPLVAEILAAPQRFEFFQAVRVIDDATWRRVTREAAAASMARRDFDTGQPHRPSGLVSRGGGQNVRLHSAITFGFPGGAIVAATRLAEDGLDVIECDVACFGLVGPGGVLPRHYTTLVSERLRRFRDRTLRDFLDVIENRSLWLLYRAWTKYRQIPLIERTRLRGVATPWDDGAAEPRDPVTASVACLSGLGTRGLPERLAVSDEVVFHYAGHYSHHPRSADALERLLSDAFGLPIGVEQFVGRWLVLEPQDQTRLASHDEPEGRNARLGDGAIAGARVWNVQSVVELVAGPLTLAQFLSLLPGAQWLRQVGDAARLYVGLALDIRVRPLLAAACVPGTFLATAGDAAHGRPPARLGWTTWLVTAGSSVDRADAAFTVP